MFDKYIVTGGTGFLGNTLLRKLAAAGAHIRALVFPGDPLEKDLPEGVEKVEGSINDSRALDELFRGDVSESCVIHCAGLVSIGTGTGKKLWHVNVEGTRNIMRHCYERKVKKCVYVSSVHAIPEKEYGETIRECMIFSPDTVVGSYAKSKAAATSVALKYASKGLDVSIVHPSGIIGPYDRGCGNITGAVISYCRRHIPVGISGGYDFVDVRDVADGIISCCEKGRRGECYILSNRYATIREIFDILHVKSDGCKIRCNIPLSILMSISPICEKISRMMKKPLFLTPYSVYTMGTNASFSHQKATRELGYNPRTLNETLTDMVSWLSRQGKIRKKESPAG